MHRRDELIVFLAILIRHERLRSRREDMLPSELTRSLEDTGRLEEIEGIAEVTSSEVSDEIERVL